MKGGRKTGKVKVRIRTNEATGDWWKGRRREIEGGRKGKQREEMLRYRRKRRKVETPG